MSTSSSQAVLAAKAQERGALQSRVLAAPDGVFDRGTTPVQLLEARDPPALLVCEEYLEAVSVDIGEGQLRSRMRALAPHNRPRTFRPSARDHVQIKLGDPSTFAHLAVRVECRPPLLLRYGQARLAHGLFGVQSHGEEKRVLRQRRSCDGGIHRRRVVKTPIGPRISRSPSRIPDLHGVSLASSVNLSRSESSNFQTLLHRLSEVGTRVLHKWARHLRV